jgi:hypothetical protein
MMATSASARVRATCAGSSRRARTRRLHPVRERDRRHNGPDDWAAHRAPRRPCTRCSKLTRNTTQITEAQYESLQSLFFNIGGTTFEWTANAQIWPRALNSTIGGEAGKIYLVAADIGSNIGSGLDFIVRARPAPWCR